MLAYQRPVDAFAMTHDFNANRHVKSTTTSQQGRNHVRNDSTEAIPASMITPELHDLRDWSFSSAHQGPRFEDATFDNTTLWSRHRYQCFADPQRTKILLSSQTFSGEMACHTSLIKLRRQCDIDMWVQVEREDASTGTWMVLN